MKTYIFLICTILFSSCDKPIDNFDSEVFNGKIVGYLKC
jgi:hypothetical protein